MNNEELKKKIKEILRKRMTELLGSCHTDEIPLTEEGAEAILFYADEFADALISAEIGDVKEAEHRAEVAEKALKHAINVCIARTETSMKKWWYKYFLREAEKELAEEGKE